MRGTTHAAIGANAVWIPVLMGSTVAPWLVGIGALAALLPDLDASESKIKNLTFGGYVGGTRVGFKPFAPVAMVISAAFGHRGVLHSLMFVAILGVGVALIPMATQVIWLVILAGYFSHLAIDGLTKSGIEFFWPIRIRIGLLPKMLRVKTGGIIDYLLLALGIFGVVTFLSQFTGQ